MVTSVPPRLSSAVARIIVRVGVHVTMTLHSMRTGHGVIVGLEGHLQMMVYLAEFLRPGHGLGAASAGIDAQKIVVRVLPQIDVGGEAGMRCGLPPVRGSLGNLRGLVAIVTIERRSYLHAQRAQFARE